MASSDVIDPKTVPTNTRLAFGVGSAAESLSIYTVGAISMLFYNQVLGLDILLAGLVPTISIFSDAISDPLLGSLSDRWRSKWGRRHPFMFIAPIPIAISFWCIFSPPVGLEGGELFAWFLVWSILLRFFMTVYHVPHLAMGGELSREYTERTKIMSYNNFFYWVGGAGMLKVNQVIFFSSASVVGNKFLDPDGYPPFAISTAVVIALVLFGSAWFTRDRIPHLPQPKEDTPPFTIREFWGDIVKAFHNPNYVWLMVALFSLSMMLGVRGAMSAYMNIFYFEFDANQFATVLLAGSFIGYITGFLFAARIHGRFDKRMTTVTTALLVTIFPAMPVILRMTGLFPENGDPMLVWGIVLFTALGAGAGSILNISVMSQLADIADENAAKYGFRQEGILYSARTFFAKLDNSLGHGVASVALWLMAFPKNAVPGEVPEETIYWLGLVDSPLAIVPGVIAACFYAKYRITKADYEATKAKLQELKV